jgi:hypothetical protein
LKSLFRSALYRAITATTPQVTRDQLEHRAEEALSLFCMMYAKAGGDPHLQLGIDIYIYRQSSGIRPCVGIDLHECGYSVKIERMRNETVAGRIRDIVMPGRTTALNFVQLLLDESSYIKCRDSLSCMSNHRRLVLERDYAARYASETTQKGSWL